MKEFRDVKPRLSINKAENEYTSPPIEQNQQPVRSHTQDNTEQSQAQPAAKKMTKAEKMRNAQGRAPLNPQNLNKIPGPARRQNLQSAGKDIVNSGAQKPAAKPKPKPQPQAAAPSYKIGAHNPPPSEVPNIVHYTAESKEDIYALSGPPQDPKQAHREKYIPRNIPVPANKRATKTSNFEEEKVAKKQGVPKTKGYIAPKNDKNFLKSNYKGVNDEEQMRSKARGAKPRQDSSTSNKNYGKVPGYLKKYNKQRDMENDRKLQMEADKDVPAGCKRMDEQERLATLRDLEANKKDVNTMLEKMPISMRTHAMTQRRNELEDKLAEIDRAIAMFSKKTVFIAV